MTLFLCLFDRPNGKSLFTQISEKYNEISKMLILIGLKSMAFILLSMQLMKIQLVKTLINSGKIDFTIKKKDNEETYLHSAVYCSNHEILCEIIRQKTKYVDSISKFGETTILKTINISYLDNAMILNREDGDDTCPIKIHDKKICLQVTF